MSDENKEAQILAFLKERLGMVEDTAEGIDIKPNDLLIAEAAAKFDVSVEDAQAIYAKLGGA